MTERPILFTGEMVRAILDGRKTQTRRVTRPQPHIDPKYPNLWQFHGGGWSIRVNSFHPVGGHSIANACPYGVPGDYLYVRHTFWQYTPPSTNPANLHVWDEHTSVARWESGEVATGVVPDLSEPWWSKKPSIHMPKWAARLWLRVTDVRVERVQEISQADALAEGCRRTSYTDPDFDGVEIAPGMVLGEAAVTVSPVGNFQLLWDSINAKRGFGWDSNCWVWVVSFERIDR